MELKKPIFIAEIKVKSPFGFQSPYSFNKLMECALEHGDWISVHDNALWGGDFDSISFVRRNTNKPILAKGIHATDDDVIKAIDHGADYVLVVDRHFGGNTKIGKQVIYERHDPNFTQTIDNKCPKLELLIYRIDCNYTKENIPLKYFCNSRDLRNGKIKEQDDLQVYINAGVWVCQASNIAKPDDVNPNVNAFIVGTNLIEYCKEL